MRIEDALKIARAVKGHEELIKKAMSLQGVKEFTTVLFEGEDGVEHHYAVRFSDEQAKKIWQFAVKMLNDEKEESEKNIRLL